MKTIDLEIAVMKDCGIRQNIVVPNTSYGIIRYLKEDDRSKFDELHECDILKVTPSGYATEYEIKVSKSDFKADLKKKHSHDSKFIKQLFYVVPVSMLDFAQENLPENSGLAFVDNGKLKYWKDAPIRNDAFKWTNEEMFKLAKLGSMRILGLKIKQKYNEGHYGGK